MTQQSQYYEIVFKTAGPIDRELLVFYGAQLGFEGFSEEDDRVSAYIPQEKYDDQTLEKLFSQLGKAIPYEKRSLEMRNWNAEWEKQFDPVSIDGRVHIRADFHPPAPQGMLEIIITPKMSFGTGHHETTELMVRLLSDMDLSGKTLIDMGSGTGVLAILAEKTCAEKIYAIDNDEWAYENMKENFRRNECQKIDVFLGGSETLEQLPAVDIFVANINRNIILGDMDAYLQKVKPGGRLLLSGFYEEDVPVVREKIPDGEWEAGRQLEKNRWIGIEFVRLGKKI